MPGRHKWRGVYAEENAFAICPAMRWPRTAAWNRLVAHLCQVPRSLPLARKCVLPARAHSAMLRRDGNLLWKGTLKEGLFCDDPQLYYGNWPGIASGLPWTRAKACAQTLNE